MSGPYAAGLGRRKRKHSDSESTTTEDEETPCRRPQEENDDFFFLSNASEPHRLCKKRRVTPTDAELVPKYRPEDQNNNVIGWLHKIDQLGDIYSWSNKDRQFIMQLRLRGSAREWYEDLEDYDLTWDQWKTALQTAFPRCIDFVDKLEQMLARSKVDGESMTKYYHEKLSLLRKCKIGGEDAISCIIRGLPSELRNNAKAYKCETPEQLYFGYLSSLENVKRVEAAYTSRKSTWKRGNTSSTAATSTQLVPRSCYVCRRPGHEARDCRSLQRCETCHRPGHTTASCWFAPSSSRQPTNQVHTTRLPLPTFSPRAVLMYSAAVGGEGAVALQLREAAPGELDAARLHDDRLAIACHEPELLADLLHAAADIDGEHDGLSALLGADSPDLALASDASDSLPIPDHDNECTTSSSSSGLLSGITTVSVAVTGLDARPLTAKKVRPKPASPNRQGPQQCQVCNKIFGNASALAKHKLTHSDERKYVCITCAKAFKRQDHLNGHMLTHRNKKPYECKAEGCGKSYCDARSLRRHTENHHQPPQDHSTSSSGGNTKGSASESDSASHRVTTPTSSPRNTLTHQESNTSTSEKSGATSSDTSPPGTPPAPATPPARPKPRSSSSKPKSTSSAQQGSQKNSGATSSGAVSAASSGAAAGVVRASDVKPVECNLCHRKFKNIPALNGHMRLHGGYFKKDSDSKKLDKKETTGPPLQTASVSVRALIEEKIISRRGATATSTPSTSTSTSTTSECVVSRAGFVAPAPPPLSSIRGSTTSPASPAASTQFASPRAPVVTVSANVTANLAQRDSTLIELLKKGNTKVVKRSASDPGQASPQQEFTFRPELFGVSFNSDDGYFSPALNEDTFQFATTPEQLEELASLEDYATVAASIRERSPVPFPSSRRLAAVLNSPLPESLADFGACHGGSPVPSPGLGYTANSPGLSYSTGDSPGLAYTAVSPGGSYSTQPEPSPGLAYPTPPASHDAHSPAHTVPRASSPLSAAFFTATMSSQEEVEEALEEVLPEECRSLDAYTLEPSPTPRRIMLNSEDPLLSSSPRDFTHQRPLRRHHRITSTVSSMDQWQHDTSLQVCVEGRDTVPAVFLSPSSVPASPQRRKRRASPAGPYRSRMRRITAHFIPQPILPPDREGSGLFSEISGLSSTECEMLSHLEEPRKPLINIGQEHQADIPELCNDRIDLHRAPEQLLWDPGINDCLDDNEVRMFMELAMCAAMPVGGHTREFALQTLGECGGDIRAATLRLMSRPAAPAQYDARWTPDEVEAFLAGLGHYDKDFYRIAQLVRTKDSKQCIQFYYFWKKVTKDYKTLYLRSWSTEHATQGSVGPVAALDPSPTFDGEEFPCKICGKVFNKVKSRSAHMKSHRPLDAEPKRAKLEKPYEKVIRPLATTDHKPPL